MKAVINLIREFKAVMFTKTDSKKLVKKEKDFLRGEQ